MTCIRYRNVNDFILQHSMYMHIRYVRGSLAAVITGRFHD